MSAHFDGGAHIEGRRLREVEVSYVDDPSLNFDGEDSDDCPASPPPTYYLRVREEKTSRNSGGGGVDAGDQGDGSGKRVKNGAAGVKEDGGEGPTAAKQAWAWRYVNVEKKTLLVWSRRGGQLLRSIPLQDVEGLTVIPDPDNLSSVLEVHLASKVSGSGINSEDNQHGEEYASCKQSSERKGGDGDSQAGVLILQARSRRETFLWAKVLQENVELLTKRQIPLENLDEETSLGDVEQLAKLLTHQLSALQQSGHSDGVRDRRQGALNTRKAVAKGAREPIPEGVEDAIDGSSP